MAKKEIPYGFIEDGKIFLKSWNQQTDRMIGEVKNEDEETSVKYFTDKYEELVHKVSELETRIREADNKGSFLMKLKHLRESLLSFDGLGDFEALEKRIDQQILYIQDIIQGNRVRNSEIKKALVEEAKSIREIVNWREATDKITDVKNRWIKTGNAVDEENDQLESDFWEIVNTFFERKKAFIEDKKKLAVHFEDKYRELIKEAKNLRESAEESRDTIVSKLKEKWKENGAVPPHIYKPLVKEFNQALRPPRKTAGFDIDTLLENLGKVKTEDIPFSSEENKEAHNQLKTFRPVSKTEKEKKSKAFELLFFIQEKKFLHSLCLKKKHGFDKLSVADQKNFKKQILLDLIERDRTELKTIELNYEKFKGQNEEVNRMMLKKVDHQKQKISIKEQILSELNG